jgi:hypothetical protein
MSVSRTPSPDSDGRKYTQELEEFVAQLMLDPDLEPIASELAGAEVR